MSAQFYIRATFLQETTTQSASGFPQVSTTDGTQFGIAMRTIVSTPTSANGGELLADGTQAIGTVRRSTFTNTLQEGNHLRADGDIYRIVGISKKDFQRMELDLYLRKVSEVQ